MVQNFYIEKYNTVFEPGCKVIYGPHAASGYLLCIAAEIAVRTVKEYKEKTGSRIEVIFNVFKDEDYEIYREYLG